MSEISLSVDAVSELIEEIKVLRAENDRLREAAKWIPVSERLPELGGDVLTYSLHEWDWHVGRLETDMGNHVIWCEHRIPQPRQLPYVTHWQPLPEPPAQTGGGQ